MPFLWFVGSNLTSSSGVFVSCPRITASGRPVRQRAAPPEERRRQLDVGRLAGLFLPAGAAIGVLAHGSLCSGSRARRCGLRPPSLLRLGVSYPVLPWRRAGSHRLHVLPVVAPALVANTVAGHGSHDGAEFAILAPGTGRAAADALVEDGLEGIDADDMPIGAWVDWAMYPQRRGAHGPHEMRRRPAARGQARAGAGRRASR